MGAAAIDIRAVSAWDRTTGSPDVRIAILDTGIDSNHPDLFPRVVLDTSFVSGTTPFDDANSRHGTAVTGIAAAKGNSTPPYGVAGVAWNVTPVSIKVLDFNNGGTVSDFVKGIDRARSKGYPIINMSLGTPLAQGDPPPPAADVAALNDACLQAFRAGHLLVAASGNTSINLNPGEDDPRFDAFPAAFQHRVYAVGAMLPDGRRWRDPWLRQPYCTSNPSFCGSSNYGPWLDVVAPGGRLIVTTRNSATLDTFYHLRACNSSNLNGMGFGGTSAAAPVVTGIAALVKSLAPTMIGDDLEQVLNLSATYFGETFPFDQFVGRGLIRASLAVNLVAPPKKVIHRIARGDVPALYLVVADSTCFTSRRFESVPVCPQAIRPVAASFA